MQAQLEVQGWDGIEACYINIKPQASTQDKEYSHPGWELGLVEEGWAELTVGDKAYKLEARDSVSFRSDSPHVLAHIGPGALRVFWIITPLRGNRYSGTGHGGRASPTSSI
jgi:quercetin dioxygenase-like cupin family protein